MNIFETKRLRRSKDKSLVFDFLNVKNKKTGFFIMLTDIYIFALALGIKNYKSVPLKSPMDEPIHVSSFTEDQRKLMDLILLYESNGNINILDKSNENMVDESIRIIEEYANGGLEIILKAIEIHPENAYQIILQLLKDELDNILPPEAKVELTW